MFPHGYFADNYWAPTYWAPVVARGLGDASRRRHGRRSISPRPKDTIYRPKAEPPPIDLIEPDDEEVLAILS